MPSSPRSSARLLANRADTGHEQFRRDTIFPSSLVGRRIAEDGDRASNISEYFSLDLPGSYLPGGRVSSSSMIHASNYCASPSPFDVRSLLLSSENEFPSLSSVDSPLLVAPLPALHTASLRGRDYSPRFPEGHRLLTTFVQHYRLGDELGAGGYGFVMTAIDLRENVEVAVKFIIKEKVPEQAWIEDEVYGRIPIEVLVLHLVDHENIVKCLEFFEDELFFYLVQELHGSPWHKRKKPHEARVQSSPHDSFYSSPPVLSPAVSEVSVPDSEPETPPQVSGYLPVSVRLEGCDSSLNSDLLYHSLDLTCKSSALEPPRPCYTRRPSHDLFECIEQTKHKRLSEKQARYIMAQVVDAVYYLDSQGIYHRDIKDENLVIDKDFKVKLIDFGSATIENPDAPSPYYKLFFGTTAYASSEVLLKRPYQAAPAEIWTLGVLMSYLLVGVSPFPTEADAIAGYIVLPERPWKGLGRSCLHLMSRCLEPNPQLRADIHEVRGHEWLKGAFDGM